MEAHADHVDSSVLKTYHINYHINIM